MNKQAFITSNWYLSYRNNREIERYKQVSQLDFKQKNACKRRRKRLHKKIIFNEIEPHLFF